MNDLKETIVKFTNSVTKTSGEILKSTKLSLSLSSEEDKLKALYLEIGKKVHEIYSYGGSLGEAFDEKIKLVEAQAEKIKELKNRIDDVRGTKSCPNCGKSIDRNNEFCPKCGHKTAEVSSTPSVPVEFAVNEEASTAPPVSEPSAKICGLCGKENPGESRFCFHCGRVI